MNWAEAGVIAAMVGQFFGILARAIPAIPNRVVPIIVLVVSFLGNIQLVVERFIEAAGIQTVFEEAASNVALAGFDWGFLKTIAKVVIAGLMALGYLPLQRAVHEFGTKALFNKGADI